jgi:hypothetical protein
VQDRVVSKYIADEKAKGIVATPQINPMQQQRRGP